MDDKAAVGRWRLESARLSGRWRDLTGLEIEFHEDHTYCIRRISPAPTGELVVEGRYEIEGERMSRWVDPGVRLNDFEIHVEGDRMIFEFPDGKEFLLTRCVGNDAVERGG